MSWSVSSPESSTKTSPCSVGFIVPASTLRYGSIFTRLTLSPRAESILPMDAVVMPLPTPDMTPPTTKIYLCPPRGPRRATIRTPLYHELCYWMRSGTWGKYNLRSEDNAVRRDSSKLLPEVSPHL